jgi:hypothetical protein
MECWLAGKLLLVLASTVILGYESRGTHDLILLSDGSGILQNRCLNLLFIKLRNNVRLVPPFSWNKRSNKILRHQGMLTGTQLANYSRNLKQKLQRDMKHIF